MYSTPFQVMSTATPGSTHTIPRGSAEHQRSLVWGSWGGEQMQGCAGEGISPRDSKAHQGPEAPLSPLQQAGGGEAILLFLEVCAG